MNAAARLASFTARLRLRMAIERIKPGNPRAPIGELKLADVLSR